MNGASRIHWKSAVTFLLFLLGLVSLSATGVTQEISPVTAGGRELPVGAVTLFSSGVGYFQHDGFVAGEESVELTFSTSDINDILKSLVVQDFDGGSVEASFPSQEPLSRMLDSFSLNIADNPSLPVLLGRARGETITVELPDPVTGTISGIEYRERSTDGVVERVPFVILRTSGGMRQIPLYEVRALRFSDAALQAELDAALALIAGNRQEDRKTVTVRFTGDGRRRVRIAYIREVPVWKTSYRMVLGDDGTAQLQGWAIVENTGESDWENVTLRLVASQPISFVMDLYSPIFRERPRVQPQLSATVNPQAYDRGVPFAPSATRSFAAEGFALAEERMDFEAPAFRDLPFDLGAGVTAAAEFEPGAVYRISERVSIPRRGAALIPIVQSEIPVERVSIFDANVLSNRPLTGVRFENATGLQLPAGPATLFDGATYGGDAQLPQTVNAQSRLLSYAVDLETPVLVRNQSTPTVITQVLVSRGTLRVTRESRLTTEYVAERAGETATTLVVVHPRRSDWELIETAAPTEELASSYRFDLPLVPGQTEILRVQERSERVQSLTLSAISDADLRFYIADGEVDSATRTALERVRDLRSAVSEAQVRRRAVEREITTIAGEQERIRENLAVIDSGSTLYQRYIDSLTQQEDRLMELQRDLSEALEAESRASEELADYIDSL